MRTGAGQFNVTQPFPANPGKRNFNAALIADYTTMLHAFVLTAQAFPIGDGSKDAGTEKAVPLWFERTIVNGLWLGYFAMRPTPDFFRGGETDPNGIKVRN